MPSNYTVRKRSGQQGKVQTIDGSSIIPPDAPPPAAHLLIPKYDRVAMAKRFLTQQEPSTTNQLMRRNGLPLAMVEWSIRDYHQESVALAYQRGREDERLEARFGRRAA